MKTAPASPPPRMPRTKVEVSRGLLIALAAVAMAGVLGVTFLVGRESARGSQPAPAPGFAGPMVGSTGAPGTSSTPSSPSAPNADPMVPTLPGNEASTPFAPAAAPGEAAPPSVASLNAASAPHDALRDEVAAYFRKVEAIQSQGKSWGDPEALAQKLLEEAGKGDSTGFDGLAAANLKVRDSLRAVSVPEPCREHHRSTMALLDESIAMLERVKGQMGGADAGSLAALATSGRDLEQKAKNVDAMAAEIKRRFGL